jgi:ribosomal protein S18 acetylase RimI-like enzyme
MAEIRRATAADAEAIGAMRLHMFLDAEVAFEVSEDIMTANFIEWVRPKLQDGTYVGWLVEEQGVAVAGAGLWVMDWPPHFLHTEPERAYLLNFYVAPAMRRQGLARTLLQLSIDEAKARGIKVVTLHASKFGKPLYLQTGFVMSNEMRLPYDNSNT